MATTAATTLPFRPTPQLISSQMLSSASRLNSAEQHRIKKNIDRYQNLIGKNPAAARLLSELVDHVFTSYGV